MLKNNLINIESAGDIAGLSKPLQVLIKIIFGEKIVDNKVYAVKKQLELESEIEQHNAAMKALGELKESNIQKIADHIPLKQLDAEVDGDWVMHFLDIAVNVSNKNMQHIWAKVLTGELSQHGSYGLRALFTLRDMQVKDALLFQKACYMSFFEAGFENFIITLGGNDTLSKYGLNYGDLLHLIDLGLLSFNGNKIKIEAKASDYVFVVDYNGCSVSIKSPSMIYMLDVIRFTEVGNQLRKLIDHKQDSAYLKAVFQYLKTKKFEIS